MTNTFSHRPVSPEVLQHILEITGDYCKVPLHSERKQKAVITDNLLVRLYLHNPEMQYAECFHALQPLCPFPLENIHIRRAAESSRLDRRSVRARLVEWARGLAEDLYAGMAGDREALENAIRRTEEPYAEGETEVHWMQKTFLLHAMFEYIPQLRDSEMYENIRNLGRKYCQLCLKKILDSLAFDLREPEAEKEEEESPELLRREVFLARRELEEYREMVEAADADFENKLEERCREEISEFFRALNDPRYGHIIDSVYLQHRACAEMRRRGEAVPYLLEGVPGLLEKMLCFFRDSNITPAIKFPPNSLQKLTVRQMEGCQFEADPARTVPLTEDTVVTVRVISSGWRYGTGIISSPILREEAASH